MKKLILSFGLMYLALGAFAQQKTSEVIISRDTINLTGYVYNYDGTPYVNAAVRSRQRDTVYNYFYLNTSTDKNGFFKLNGAKLNDTISVLSGNGGLFYNKGGRYMVLYMPAPIKIDFPLKVTAHRISAKQPIKFAIKKLAPGWYDSEQEPAYHGGMNRFKDSLYKKLKYPEKAVSDNIEGTVEIGFTILKDGTIGNYKILKGLGYGCEDEVIRVMKTFPKWSPGLMNGRRAELNYMIDVEFKLTDN